MKKFLVQLLFIFIGANAFAQGVAGYWNGKLKVGAIELRIVFHVYKTGELYSGTMDSPDQGAKGIPLSSVRYEKDTLFMEMQSAGIKYSGVLKSDSEIVGNFRQGPQSFPLNLTKQTGELTSIKRPQEPVKPYSYLSEDIHFTNKRDHIEFAGTLTIPNKEENKPDKKYTAVVLITGSGPQNRDEEIMGHKPFLVISDYLTRRGIVVLRFDDRGTGESQGDFKTATTLDFSYDAEAALNYLKSRKEINQSKIGLIGHSEGGIIAPMIAARAKGIAFIVLLAGPGLRGDNLLLLQQAVLGKASGMTDSSLAKQFQINRGAFDIILNENDSGRASAALQGYIRNTLKENNGAIIPPGVSEEDFVNGQVRSITSPWMRYFLNYDPAFTLEKVNCPVLAIGGDKDLQVPPAVNLDHIHTALVKGGNKNVTIKEYTGLNHLLQDAENGSPAEYAKIEETISPVVLKFVGEWVLAQ